MIGIDVKVHISKKLRESPDHQQVMPLIRVGQVLGAAIRFRVGTTGKDHKGRDFPHYAESTRGRTHGKRRRYWIPPTMRQPAAGRVATTTKGFTARDGAVFPAGSAAYETRQDYLAATGRPKGYTFHESGSTWEGLTSSASSGDKVRVQFRGSSLDRTGRKMTRNKRIGFACRSAKHLRRSILMPSDSEVAAVLRWLGEQLPKGLVTDPNLARALASEFRRAGVISRKVYRDLNRSRGSLLVRSA